MRIGLTGGIASGKSTVCTLFSGLGVDIIDADVAARQVVEPGQTGLLEIINLFGKQVLHTDGHLDRQQMRQLIFDSPALRSDLEAIIHPRVRELMLREAGQSRSAYCILCIPLLVENRLQDMVDRLLVVDTDTFSQKQRLMARDTSSPAQVEAILAVQASRAQRLAAADDVIVNDQDQALLAPQVAALHEKYLQLAQNAPTGPL